MPIVPNAYGHLALKVGLIYEEAERQVMKTIANQVVKGIDRYGWAEKKLREIDQIVIQTNTIINSARLEATAFSGTAMKQAYTTSSLTFKAEAMRRGMAVSGYAGTNVNKVARILAETSNYLIAAQRTALRSVRDVYMQIVGENTALLATGSVNLRTAVQRSLTEFADKGITSYYSKNGSQWDLKTYTEMAVRTGLARATIAGYIDEMAMYGEELAIVSSHMSSCQLCAQWEDVVISVTGSSKDYPSLDDAMGGGLFHPNCLHDITAYEPLVMKSRRFGEAPLREPVEEDPSYSQTQKQRYIERMIRKWKRRMAVSIDKPTERYAMDKVQYWRRANRRHINNARLRRDYSREGGQQKLRLQ